MVVLTPHWHSEGEPGKHTWSGRSAPPPRSLGPAQFPEE